MFLYFFQEDKELLSKMTPQNPFLLWLSRVKGSSSGPGHALGAQQRELLCGSRAEGRSCGPMHSGRGEKESGAEPVPSRPAPECAAVSPRELRGTLGSLCQLYPPLFNPSVPAQVQRGGENMLETGPPNHVEEPPCSSPAGDKDIIVRPTDTPLSN